MSVCSYGFYPSDRRKEWRARSLNSRVVLKRFITANWCTKYLFLILKKLFLNRIGIIFLFVGIKTWNCKILEFFFKEMNLWGTWSMEFIDREWLIFFLRVELRNLVAWTKSYSELNFLNPRNIRSTMLKQVKARFGALLVLGLLQYQDYIESQRLLQNKNVCRSLFSSTIHIKPIFLLVRITTPNNNLYSKLRYKTKEKISTDPVKWLIFEKRNSLFYSLILPFYIL